MAGGRKIPVIQPGAMPYSRYKVAATGEVRNRTQSRAASNHEIKKKELLA